MHIVIVHIHVKPEAIDEFIIATKENARNSNKESGISRFDVIQMVDDPSRFELIEVYKSPEDQLKHRETEHYKVWKEKAEKMMAEPRQGVKYINIFPE
jgi:(4S)-4-hydroxy-5-phosphonooxypentane-2,3-dione isomerase